jgi:hypothetical protein
MSFDPNVAKLQRDETVTSVKELRLEEIMKMMGVASTANDLEDYEEGEDVQETRITPPAPRAQDIKGLNVNADEGVNKRAHENSAHTGHKVHPTKVPRVEPISALRSLDQYQSSCASDSSSGSYANMSSTASSHSSSSYDSAYMVQSAQSTKQNRQGNLLAFENDNPFAPLRFETEYAITNDDDVSSIDTPPSSRQWEINPRHTGRGRGGKCSRKGKGGKDPNWNEAYYSIIPPFGDATARKLAIKLYTINDFFQYESDDHYHVHLQRVHEKSNLPGYITTSPSDTFVRQRLLPTQSYDQTVSQGLKRFVSSEQLD